MQRISSPAHSPIYHGKLEHDRAVGMLSHALTYSSDLIIRDVGVLASLSVFFDHVYLPHLPHENAGLLLRLIERNGDCDVDLVDLPFAGEYLHRWDELHATLFANGVLTRLPQITSDVHVDDKALKGIVEQLHPNISGCSRRLYLLARVVHHLRLDQLAPHVIDSVQNSPTRGGYNWLMAHEAFTYLIPALNGLDPSQILEVRDKVADTREGFAMHLQRLSREVERRTAAGDPMDTIRAHARSVIETDLIPDFAEFRRQLSAERTGFWGKLLDVAALSLNLLVPASRPDFAASGFSTLSAIMAIAGEQRHVRNTNVHHAFQFLVKVTSEMEKQSHLPSKIVRAGGDCRDAAIT